MRKSMGMREVLVGGILCAVLLILGHIVMGSPWFRHRLQEGFSSGVFNSTTECPAGSTMYMYGGSAYCCSGQIRPDADRAQNSCKLMWTRSDSSSSPPVFCTLGPSKDGIQNCLAERGGLMQSQGATVCPPQMPNFVMDPSGNSRCCSGPGNSAQTQCLDPNLPSCTPVTGNMFLGTTPSCQLLRAQSTDGPCPAGFNNQVGSMSLTNANGSTSMLNVYYCSNHSSNCYSPGIIARLNALGYDTKILPVCT